MSSSEPNYFLKNPTLKPSHWELGVLHRMHLGKDTIQSMHLGKTVQSMHLGKTQFSL